MKEVVMSTVRAARWYSCEDYNVKRNCINPKKNTMYFGKESEGLPGVNSPFNFPSFLSEVQKSEVSGA